MPDAPAPGSEAPPTTTLAAVPPTLSPPSPPPAQVPPAVGGAAAAVTRVAGLPKKAILAAAVVVLLLTLGVGGCVYLWKGTSPAEQKIEDLAALAAVLDTYFKRTGSYPAPTVRQESAKGVRHVWGYRPGVPAQASCSLVQSEDGRADPLASSCGGDIHDAAGKIIGWKGTITTESALNSLQVASNGANPESPLLQFTPNVPRDPEFLEDPALLAAGFGEYVYAVRLPEDGAQERGGMQYQLAATVREKTSGELRTLIQGTYFAPTDRPGLPASLIGPGVIFDGAGRLTSASAHHVLLHGQAYGEANPALGEGERVVALLRLRRSLEVLREALTDRTTFLQDARIGSPEEVLLTTLKSLDGRLGGVEKEAETEGSDPQALEPDVQAIATDVEEATEEFLRQKAAQVERLVASSAEGEDVVAQLDEVFGVFRDVEEQILLGRDEILRYLAGEGVEMQVRGRTGRKIQSALELLVGLQREVQEGRVAMQDPFLTEVQQEQLEGILAKEVGLGRERPLGAGTVSGFEEILQGDVSLLTAPLGELRLLLEELQDVLVDVGADLQVTGVPLVDLDRRLHILLRSLGDELDHIEGLRATLASPDQTQALLAIYRSSVEGGELLGTLSELASLSGQHGDFSGLSFSSGLLSVMAMQPQAGVPDLSDRHPPSQAQYSGIPYPLPWLNAWAGEKERAKAKEMEKERETQQQEGAGREEAEGRGEVEEPERAEEDPTSPSPPAGRAGLRGAGKEDEEEAEVTPVAGTGAEAQ